MQVNTLNNVFPTQMQKGFYLVLKRITENKISESQDYLQDE